MKPQSSQRNPLCSPKEFLLKEITEKIISCAVIVELKAVDALPKICKVQVLTYLGAVDNFNVSRLREGTEGLII
jgi:hypothetical protein